MNEQRSFARQWRLVNAALLEHELRIPLAIVRSGAGDLFLRMPSQPSGLIRGHFGSRAMLVPHAPSHTTVASSRRFGAIVLLCQFAVFVDFSSQLLGVAEQAQDFVLTVRDTLGAALEATGLLWKLCKQFACLVLGKDLFCWGRKALRSAIFLQEEA